MHNTQSQWITALLMALLVLPLTAINHARGQGQGPVPNLDNDRDGIPDRIEAQLLARFTPYFRFSMDGGEERYRPMDALHYVRWSVTGTSQFNFGGTIPSSQKRSMRTQRGCRKTMCCA